jgi:hypothetical protein
LFGIGEEPAILTFPLLIKRTSIALEIIVEQRGDAVVNSGIVALLGDPEIVMGVNAHRGLRRA